MERDELNKTTTAGNNSSAKDNKKDDQPAKPVHNPFEDGAPVVTPEELEQEELFKEAQTERD